MVKLLETWHLFFFSVHKLVTLQMLAAGEVLWVMLAIEISQKINIRCAGWSVYDYACILYSMLIDEEINKDGLLLLTRSLLSSLVLKVGPRARFLAKLAELKNDVQAQQNSVQVQQNSASASVCDMRKHNLQSLPISCFICQRLFNGWHYLNKHVYILCCLGLNSNDLSSPAHVHNYGRLNYL